jgi:hypothetical protein
MHDPLAASDSPPIALPERVTVMTCIGCGAMGREDRCGGNCSEHKLMLVAAADLDELLAAAQAARARAERMAGLLRRFADADARPGDPGAAFAEIREAARRTLHEVGREEPRADWSDPDTVIGWWCATCGNVDMPRPCIGVCIWRPAEWVNVELYERQRSIAQPWLAAAGAMGGLLSRVASVTPRPDQALRTWSALRTQARDMLERYEADTPVPETPSSAVDAEDGEPVIDVRLWGG